MKNILDRANPSAATEIVNFSYEQAQDMLGLKATALRERIKTLSIVPERDGKTPYLNRGQIDQIKAFNQHLAEGGNIATFKKKLHDANSLLGESNNQSDFYLSDAPIDKYEGNISQINRNAMDAIAMNPRLQAYAQLEIYLSSNEAISDSEIMALFGWKPPRTRFRENCYEFIKYSFQYYTNDNGKLVREKTWKIRKVNIEEENRLKLEAKRQRATEDQQHKEKAESNYLATKELMNDE